MEYIYVDVAIPIPHFSLFTYKIKKSYVEELEDKTLVGRRVLVPFRNTGLTGVIVKKSEKKENIDIKEIFDIPDKKAVFSEKYIQIVENLSKYYVTPLGIFLYYILPEGLRWKYNPKTKKWIKKAKQEKIYRIKNINQLSGLSQRAEELLEFIIQHGEVTYHDIKNAGFSINSLKTLVKKGIVLEESLIFSERYLKQKINTYKKLEIKRDFYIYYGEKFKNRLNTYTGLINKNLKENKSTLLVFPNISSVQKVFTSLKRIYGEKVLIYCDVLPEKEKIKNWFYAKSTGGSIIVGTFSSLFIPVKDLSTIIVEEEYSESYKAKRTPKFDARRVAFEIYKTIPDISLIFSSYVPSVESFYSLKRKIGKKLPVKKQKSRSPEIKIEPFKSFKDIEKIIIKTVKESPSTLILANKRGYSSFLYCQVCQQEIMCNRCDVPVKVYKSETPVLKCDICGKKYHYVENCPECEHKLKEIGFGIEKIIQILKNRGIAVSDIESKESTNVKITVSLSGKEALTDEFHTVINLYPDFYLNIPDFRSNEKFFRNVMLPFSKAKQKYLLITNAEETTSIKSLLEKNIDLFLQEELKERKELQLPPFVKYILLTFEKKDLDIKEVESIFKNWIKEKSLDVEYEGIFYAQFSKIRGKKRVQILLKNFSKKEYLLDLQEKANKKGIKLNIDVDPKDIK